MSKLVHGSAWLSAKLLLLYPSDLRREFGCEMTLAFADDMAALGVFHVWWCALRELLVVALPAQMSNRCVLVPALSFALAAVTMSLELWLAFHRVAHVDVARLADSIRFAVLLPSVLNAMVALVVTRVLAHYSITALQLD